jgi:hypothetical protein
MSQRSILASVVLATMALTAHAQDVPISDAMAKANADRAAEIAAMNAATAERKAQWDALNAEIEARKASDAVRLEAQEAAAAELAKKPSARIGMTAKQVREKTNWGVPNSVNTTMVSGHVHEQWVYDENQYLYFDNGRLTSIQNSH